MLRSSTKPWDYIIVGAGSAGCVLADRLTEDGETRVLLLEAGGRAASPYSRFPAAFLKVVTNPKYNWLYQAEPDPSTNNAVAFWSAGRVLGGSSAINVVTWTRGHRLDYDRWESLGCRGWGYKDVLPYFRRSETFEGGADAFRGSKGPQHVSYSGIDHPLIDAFIHAAEQRGFPFNPDLNAARQEGVGYSQVSERRGFRDSAATSYLAEARRRRNLEVERHAFASRVLVDNGRAVGVEYRTGNQTMRAHANAEVVLCAGAIGTPKLLMLSGIGPGDALRAAGIDVLVDSRGVGANLQDHPFVTFAHAVSSPTLNVELNLRGIVTHGLDFVLHGRGGVTACGANAIAFSKGVGAADSPPDFEFTFRPFGVARVESGEGAEDEQVGFSALKPMTVPAVEASAWLCHPAARGSVTLRSADIMESPIIRHQAMGTDADVRGLTQAGRLLREIFSQDALRVHVTGELRPGSQVESDEEWEAYLREHVQRANHPSGTCKMGVDEMAVVDPDLRVRGVQRLRVVDASVMPRLVTGHTNAPTIMIAERCSDLIRRDRVTRASEVKPGDDRLEEPA